MTAPQRVRAAVPQLAPGRPPGDNSAPRRLRAVPAVRPSPRVGFLAFAAMVMVFAILLAAAMAHSQLITGQRYLDHLGTRAARERSTADRLRLQVADLESPGRIVLAAQAQGMVLAQQTTWLRAVRPGETPPSPPVTAPAPSTAPAGP